MWLERLAGWVDRLWRPALRVLALLIETVGAHLLLLLNVVRWMVRPPLRLGVLIEAMVFVGFESLPIVLLIVFSFNERESLAHDRRATLLKLTERYCVVLQTIAKSPELSFGRA